ncbi:N-acetylmuramoyl-L-alanine amidase [Pseudomonas sp. FW300-N1A1]|uniref:N-acetylmuramoyl-L-alanine amidase n=1 Tax=Pseudomonas sp. FW300-N1A1 TaxID=2075555 RepID=UPI000CD07B5A|nr:N-acetylmuramoyl-L-alanine amidase [Pseudomonas sp. FW300-N1A1]POA17476.1 N-acetylmuramoyl-L-alanine amidase [Pseudomonas sp. FW300-N1A1]
MFPINTQYRSTKGYNSRIRFLILHYTAGNFSSSIAALTGPSVSAHYLIPDVTDPTYAKAGLTDQQIFSLVDERQRAWHAGVSQWDNRNNLNDTSIGIEVVNLASDNQGHFNFPPYHPLQVAAIEQLALDILKRYPDISARNVLGHSDISIGRKSDPGPEFPWHALYLKGIGAWFDPVTQRTFFNEYQTNGLPTRQQSLTLFKSYGYDIKAANTKSGFQQLVRAFQLHFRPEKYDGAMDLETAANLAALVKKYSK